ncbi:MAG: outer membrane lipoprotein-sorting protein [Acidobacteriota bacterium]
MPLKFIVRAGAGVALLSHGLLTLTLWTLSATAAEGRSMPDATAGADSAAAKGHAIAARSDRSDRGFGDSEVELQMILRNRAGDEATRALRITTLEVPDETVGDKSLVVFDEPRDIAGTAFLSHAKILEADDQWLYLPSLRRVKRISSANKSGPFLGSEFAFEDFTAQELEKFDYRFVRTEPCGDLVCDVIELTPRYEHSGYTRLLAWIDQTDHQYRRIEFFDRGGEALKTLEIDAYRQYEGGIWRGHRQTMTNHKNGKTSIFVYGDYAFGVGLTDDDFVKSVLRRTR